MKLSIFSPLIFLAFTVICQAGIEFETTEVKADVKASDETVDMVFKFKITGEKAVEILNIESHCGCLVGSVQEKIYQPGSTGEVNATFKVGAFEGEVSKGLSIFTDDPEHAEVALTGTLVIPVIFEFQPKLTTWVIGDKCESKKVHLTIAYEEPIAITKIESSREHMKAVLTEIKAGLEYEITLTPSTTADYTLGAVFITTDCKIEKYRTRQIFFNIVPKKEAAGNDAGGQ